MLISIHLLSGRARNAQGFGRMIAGLLWVNQGFPLAGRCLVPESYFSLTYHWAMRMEYLSTKINFNFNHQDPVQLVPDGQWRYSNAAHKTLMANNCCGDWPQRPLIKLSLLTLLHGSSGANMLQIHYPEQNISVKWNGAILLHHKLLYTQISPQKLNFCG